jgi:hypothetical protein
MTPAKQKIWDDYIKGLEEKYPGIFDSNKEISMTRPKDEELKTIITDVCNAIIGAKPWSH